MGFLFDKSLSYVNSLFHYMAGLSEENSFDFYVCNSSVEKIAHLLSSHSLFKSNFCNYYGVVIYYYFMLMWYTESNYSCMVYLFQFLMDFILYGAYTKLQIVIFVLMGYVLVLRYSCGYYFVFLS